MDRLGAGEIARALASRAPQLVRDLLPAGKRIGAEWRVGSLAGEPGLSCAVHLFGPKAGVWGDFATGEVGDALDLVAAVLYRGNKSEALRWARDWLGLGDALVPKARYPRDAAPCRPREPVPDTPPAETGDYRRAALALYLRAQPSLLRTPAAAYLLGRGIDLAELGRQPAALRYHPQLPNRESGRNLPALVAAISDATGAHVATHRTWLEYDSGGFWRKARLQQPKMSLGRLLGGTIRLWRGASGKPLASAPDGESVVIGEGIETCLSVAMACPEYRVLCAVSLANMGAIVLPEQIGEVILLADNDGDNAASRRCLQRAVDHFLKRGRPVRIARAPVGKDFNDTSREMRATG